MATLKSFTKGTEFPPLTPGKLRLYSMRFCPFAQRTRMVLAHKKIPFETVNVDLKEKPAWFLERNPMGLVPVLEQDDKVVYESVVTCDYLEDLYPEDKLNPSDPYRKARDSILVQMFSKALGGFYSAWRNKDQEALEKMWVALTPFEAAIGERGTFFGGEQPTMLDFMLWPWFERMPSMAAMTGLEPLPKERFPNLNGWVEHMLTTPEVKETISDVETHVGFSKSYATGKPDYDIGLE